MPFEYLGKTKDLRTGANVVYCKCSILEYLNIVGTDFENFSIQRKKEAHKAYQRLKDDLKQGALLPAITLSVKHHKVSNIIEVLDNKEQVVEKLNATGEVDILDGLQRTYIINDLYKDGHKFLEGQEVLLEFWLEESMSKLIYRMIVLNAGQKAMSMRHQIELLFMSLKETISEKISDIDIFIERDGQRRTLSNKYSLSILASAYQAFLTKGTEVDKNNIVSDELMKNSVMDSSENEHTEQFNDFIDYFKIVKKIDEKLWDKYSELNDPERLAALKAINEKERTVEEQSEFLKLSAYKNAHLWLGNENVMLSLFCAIAQFKSTGKEDRVKQALLKLENNTSPDPIEIVTYEALKSGINPRKSNVGHATRKLLLNGFKEYFRDEGDTNFAMCWEQASD
ncbi:hypothetical protein L4C39_03735 [Vibrio clamense]|uniref:hypothetical protein n=1 Tax=Vibrio clamense TaxID=2910254 RepID=UPI003D238DE7